MKHMETTKKFWQCINCETSNPLTNKICEVCDYERVYTASELEEILKENASLKGMLLEKVKDTPKEIASKIETIKIETTKIPEFVPKSPTTVEMNSVEDTDTAWWNSLSKEWQEVLYNYVLWKEKTTLLTHHSFLRILTNLTELDTRFKHITDFSPLQNLRNLTKLNLNYSGITNISFLSSLMNLTELHLCSYHRKITDISPLQNLKSLTKLALSGNGITDISVLQSLTNLTSLDISYNEITNHSILQSLKKLTSLNLRANGIADYSFLNELTNLTHLNLSGNRNRDISTLQNLTNLTHLNLSGNRIKDVSPLCNLKRLVSLNLDHNSIMEIPSGFLNSFPKLEYFYLYDNLLRFEIESGNILLDIPVHLRR